MKKLVAVAALIAALVIPDTATAAPIRSCYRFVGHATGQRVGLQPPPGMSIGRFEQCQLRIGPPTIQL